MGHWQENRRRALFQGRRSIEEHNNALEMRTLVAALKHLSRTSRSWGHRALFFPDPMVSLGALRKGCSSARVLPRLARIGGIIQMVRRVRGYFRWAPSELNLADGPSRGLGVGAAVDAVALHAARRMLKEIMRRLRRRNRQAGRGRSPL